MQKLSWLLLLCSASGQVAANVPTVHDAYVLSDGGRVRELRLRDYLQVVVCKNEYDEWAKSRNPAPTLSLYIDGRLMKGVEPARPAPAVDPMNPPVDKRTQAVQEACAEGIQDIVAAEKIAADKQVEGKSAVDKASAETDPVKKVAAQKDASEKTAAAKAEQDIVDALKAKNARYTFEYYLDPQVTTKVETKDSWLRLLERPWNNRPVGVSVGSETGPPWPSESLIEFRRINLWWLMGWAALFFVAIVLFVRYAKTSDIIRDPGTLPAPPPGIAPQKAYSLARTQMALWTFLVAGALAFIFLVTWNENTITSGVLTLIGMSFGTTLLAATADGTQPVPQTSKGFFTDLLSDGTGPSFHRYQMVLFTVILAVIFVAKAASSLVMPDFDATLLGLMGISSGTYLGFKLQGK